jgi:hypothetical protein
MPLRLQLLLLLLLARWLLLLLLRRVNATASDSCASIPQV